jgi:hypothetical protein
MPELSYYSLVDEVKIFADITHSLRESPLYAGHSSICLFLVQFFSFISTLHFDVETYLIRRPTSSQMANKNCVRFMAISWIVGSMID